MVQMTAVLVMFITGLPRGLTGYFDVTVRNSLQPLYVTKQL